MVRFIELTLDNAAQTKISINLRHFISFKDMGQHASVVYEGSGGPVSVIETYYWIDAEIARLNSDS